MSPKDFSAKIGILDNSKWHYHGISAYEPCALTTKAIFLPKESHLIPSLNIKLSVFTWLKEPQEIYKIELFKIKVFSETAGIKSELFSVPFMLSELTDITTYSEYGNDRYIEAKSNNDQYITTSKLISESNTVKSGYVSFCISNISKRTEISINSLNIEVLPIEKEVKFINFAQSI
ncbi:hypothetical protein [Fluviispira multicolorata]|uniref:Uncharacterized protein n=1 Tax=Fluviispira multicolorata TaxID=2654512 RepID=A0A833JBX5_9BACT|nr:hypothetical protein [Fluviispira multicolorata]KAB8029813.1 hypothetical protein GCL57_09750 [Fluviispira multicolorata]